MIYSLAITWADVGAFLSGAADVLTWPIKAVKDLVVGEVTDFMRDMMDALEAFARWAVCVFFDIVRPFLEYMLDSIPANIQTAGSEVLEFFGHANEWIPIGYFFQLMLAYVVFAIGFSIIKIGVKAIPTVG